MKQTNIQLIAGDEVSFFTGGGGGYGDPKNRNEAAIMKDFNNGLISAKVVESEYGLELVGSTA